MKWADHCISAVWWKDGKPSGTLERFRVHVDGDSSVGAGVDRSRAWVTQRLDAKETFATITRTSAGKWKKLGFLQYKQGTKVLTWDGDLPLLRPRRKVFVSYYHHDDGKRRTVFENLTDDLFLSKSVGAGEIAVDASDEYVKQLIQKGHLSDTSVVVVLVGPKTHCRKHVDWEISGGLDFKVGEMYAGLVGILLPSHPSHGKPVSGAVQLPKRLAANVKSGYAVLADWTENRVELQRHVENAYARRTSAAQKRVNRAVPQMSRDTCK